MPFGYASPLLLWGISFSSNRTTVMAVLFGFFFVFYFIFFSSFVHYLIMVIFVVFVFFFFGVFFFALISKTTTNGLCIANFIFQMLLLMVAGYCCWQYFLLGHLGECSSVVVMGYAFNVIFYSL